MKKLTLKKEVVAELSGGAMKEIQGGTGCSYRTTWENPQQCGTQPNCVTYANSCSYLGCYDTCGANCGGSNGCEATQNCTTVNWGCPSPTQGGGTGGGTGDWTPTQSCYC